MREDAELDVEVYQCKSVKHESYPFQLHKTVTVDATSRKESRKIAAGTFLVKTAQPLGSLAVYLLEPQSEDGLTTWNFFDESLVEGKDFPVLRLKSGVPEMTAPVQPLREKP